MNEKMAISTKCLTQPGMFFAGKSLTVIHSHEVDPVKIVYPENIKKLVFRDRSLVPPRGTLIFPETITDLELDVNYDLSCVIFPPRLEKLKLGHYFNQSIEDLDLPETLKELTLGHRFNCQIRNLNLPQGLTHLTFGDKFNQDVINAQFPESLTHLSFGLNFNRSLHNANLPQGLTHLVLGRGYSLPLAGANLPRSLIVISISPSVVNDRVAGCNP